MPNATVSLLQERTNLVNGYRVHSKLTAATGISPQLFVFRASDQIFDHVSTLFDLSYPTAIDAPNFDFYRQDECTRDFPDVTTALEFANYVKFRVQEILAAYTPDFVAFAGAETTPYQSP